MKKNLHKIAAMCLAAALLLGILSACGNNQSSTPSAPGASSEPPAVQTGTVGQDVEAATALSDNSITVGYGTAIDSLTPFRAQVARNAPMFIQMYETLAVLDENQELQPYVAKSWDTEDGVTYSFEIWDTVTDSAGNKITADDVVWFIEESKSRALKPIFSKVNSVTKTGDYTFDVVLNANQVGTIEALMQDTFIISKAAFEASSDEFGLTTVSTSPYKVVEFTPSASVAFERRDDYWQDIENLPECVRPVQKTVNYQIITEASQLGIALETKTVDLVIDLASSTGSQFAGRDEFVTSLMDGPQGWQIFFSGADSSTVGNNELLRQAILYAIDENGMVQAISAGYGTTMHDVSSSRLIGYQKEWDSEDYYNYDVEKAQQLLKDSGYNGETVKILSTSSATSSRIGQLVQNYLIAIGVKADLNSVDMALYQSTRLDGTQYDIVVGTIGGSYLPDYWSIRFDPAAYSTGDATSRKDDTLAQMLYSTWTNEGFTAENINKVHNYIKDHAYGYGLVNPQVITIWRNDCNITKEVRGGISGFIVPSACQIG